MDRVYANVADRIASEISEGKLRPGERLPPQRTFAHKTGIAPSTASRAYAELARRGLVVGEVGRGTFVRGAPAPFDPALVEPTVLPVDLELVFPMPPGTAELLAASLKAHIIELEPFSSTLKVIGVAGTMELRQLTASLLGRAGWTPDPSSLLFAANGRGAIAAILSALVPPGGRIGVETMTYPVVKGLATRLGLSTVPITMDAAGAMPEAALEVHRATPLSAIYLQPSLHSPLGATMGPGRRRAWATFLEQQNLFAIEDAIYGFLAPGDEPLAAFAPSRVIHVDSLSKRGAPGLSLAFLAPPASLVTRIAAALRGGAWAGAGFAAAAAAGWMADGTLTALAEIKRRDAVERQRVAHDELGSSGLRADPRAYHAWLPLPEPWRAEAFVVAALRRGIAITPGSAFAAAPGYAPAGVRLALAAPPLVVLREALRNLRDLLGQEPNGEAE